MPFSLFEKRPARLPGCMHCLLGGRSVRSKRGMFACLVACSACVLAVQSVRKKACMPARYHESIRFVVLVIVVVVVSAIAVAVVVVAIVVVGSM